MLLIYPSFCKKQTVFQLFLDFFLIFVKKQYKIPGKTVPEIDFSPSCVTFSYKKFRI